MTRGAYGLRLGGDAPRSSLLTPVAADAPEVLINRMVGSIELENRVDDDHATVPLLDGGGLQLDRAARSALITTDHELTDDELAHPYLAPIAAVHSYWLGRAAFHAGGIIVGGVAWGVIGEREAGKSTLLAAVEAAGGLVVADDLLVLDGPSVFAGPRTLDLREETAELFPGTREIGVAGARARWRLDLKPAPEAVPLGGWVLLSWSAELSIVRTSGAAAAHHLASARSVQKTPLDPSAFLIAAAQPAIAFARPRDLSAIEAGVVLLLDELTKLS